LFVGQLSGLFPPENLAMSAHPMMKHTAFLLLLPALVGCSEATSSTASTDTTSAKATLAAAQTPQTEAAETPEDPTTPPTKAADKPEKSKSSPTKDAAMSKKVVRSEEEWKKLLTPEQYHVLRQKGTERPFQNKYDEHFEPGTYACAACGLELFSSETKFNSGCGWPAFYAAKAGDRVNLATDLSHDMVRTEVTCARCDSHLGHVFEDAPQTPTGERFCINSVSLKFLPNTAQDAKKAAK
jgi:peptide-methionine (R)-S-oxide reductase